MRDRGPRVPWLDLEFVRWTLTLPDRALTHHGRRKWLPRHAAAQAIGPALANRAKRGLAGPAATVAPGTVRREAGRFRQGAYFARPCAVLEAHELCEQKRS